MNKKPFYLPQAWEISDDWRQPEDGQTADPYDRPDGYDEQAPAPQPDGFETWTPEAPVEPCPCCGSDIPENPLPGYICPACWWEIDPFLQSGDEPSDQNHGLSLNEARLNVHSFGISAPWLLCEDADET